MPSPAHPGHKSATTAVTERPWSDIDEAKDGQELIFILDDMVHTLNVDTLTAVASIGPLVGRQCNDEVIIGVDNTAGTELDTNNEQNAHRTIVTLAYSGMEPRCCEESMSELCFPGKARLTVTGEGVG